MVFIFEMREDKEGVTNQEISREDDHVDLKWKENKALSRNGIQSDWVGSR